MSITTILILIGAGVVAVLVVWLSIRGKINNKKIDKAKEVLGGSKEADKARKEVIKELESHIIQLGKDIVEFDTQIVELRSKTRKMKDENEKGKALAKIAELLAEKNATVALAKREKRELDNKVEEDEKISTNG